MQNKIIFVKKESVYKLKDLLAKYNSSYKIILLRELHYITTKRVWNELKCFSSFLLSFCGIVRINHKPTFVSLEPANYCMLSCPQCPVGMRNGNISDRKLMDKSLYKKIIDEISSYAHTVILYFQGEPLLNPELSQMVKYAHDKKLYTIISTNGLLLTEKVGKELKNAGLDKITISIDGFSQESYEKYRVGGNLQKALEGLKNCAGIPCVELQCLRLSSNEKEWDWIRANYKQLGATKLSMKTAQFYNYEEGNELMPSDEKYSRYKLGKDGKYHIKNPLRNHCFRLWSGCVIDVNGIVLPCCFDKEHRYSFGKINKDYSLAKIWYSDSAMVFRRRIVRERKNIDICQNCTE